MINNIINGTLESKTQILEEYYGAFKNPVDFKVGLEYERVSVDSDTLLNAQYAGEKSLVSLITQFANTKGWGILKDRGVVIGATNGKSMVSLEPGGQLEISLEAKETISEVQDALDRINASLLLIARLNNIDLLPYGIAPKSSWDYVSMVPKMRYKIMSNYLPPQGRLAHVMMRETASVQINYDYKDEIDAVRKLKAANLMSPFMSALFANSPIRKDKINGFKSYRCLAWLHTDNKRCGLFYKNLFNKEIDFTIEDYVDAVFDVPMLFIERNGLIIDLLGDVTFREFFEYGFEGYYATMEDWYLHASLCFPDVRFKNCIEIRNHDSQKPALALAIAAFYKGILYDENALNETLELLGSFSFEDIEAMKMLSAKAGLNYEVKGKRLIAYVRELFRISREALVKKAKGDELYLDKAMVLVDKDMCPADLLALEKIEDSKSLVRYLRRN